MSLTVATLAGEDSASGVVKLGKGDNLKLALRNITFDSSYPTGGEAVTAANFGLTSILAMICLPTGGYVASFDAANSKILVYLRGAITENAAGSYTQSAVLAAAAFAEVADTSNLSTLTVQCWAIGR